MMELKKVRKEKAISHAEEEEETEEKVENEENEEINVNETRGRYEELVDIGIGQRSIQGPSRPIHERAIGVTAQAAASALKSAQNYEIKGKSWQIGPGWRGQSLSVTLSTKMSQECREKRAQLIDGKSSVWLTRQSR